MSRFLPNEAFQAPANQLELLPIRFERAGGDRYLVSNMVGEFLSLQSDELDRLVELQVRPGDGLYEKAYAAHLITRTGQNSQKQLLALRLRSRMGFLQYLTPLHIFVVTLRCEHSCPYCQVSRQSTDRKLFDMSEEAAQQALMIALSTPSPKIKIEFQGGEPLLNVDLIEKIVISAKAEASKQKKEVQFVIATNLALLTDSILAFCKAHQIQLSTSLDGPADLHNKNRPRPGGNSHDLATRGIRRAQKVLGRDQVSALMTTTERSFYRVEEIVDEYLALGLDGIFLRPLSPYGFAIKTKSFAQYDGRRWLDFYERGIRYILSINASGVYFPEFYASLILKRMLTDR